MRRLRSLQQARRAQLAGEDGFVMVIVMVLLLVALLLGAVGVAESLDSNTFSVGQSRVMRAQQATDAGIQRILYEEAETNIDNWNLNGGILGLATVLDCVVPQLNVSLQVTGLASADVTAGVCPAALTSGGSPTSYVEPLGNHAFESSEFFPGATNFLNGTTIGGQNGSGQRQFFPRIVSLGWDDNGINKVYSRQEAILAPIAPLQAVEGENSVTLGGLTTLLGLGANILNGNVVSRGTLTTPTVEAGLNLNGSPSLLATLAYTSGSVPGLVVANVQKVSPSAIIKRAPPILSGSKPDCPVAAYCTGIAGSQLGTAYSPTYDTFSLSSGSVTFPSGDYVFCSFNAAAGTTINVNPTSANAPVRIFIDNPNSTRCAADKAHSDSNIGSFNDPAGFTNSLLGTGGLVNPSGMQVYVVGDGAYDDSSIVQVGPVSTGGLLSLSALTYGAVIYAPTSKVTVNVPGLCVIIVGCTGGIFSGSVIGNDTSVTALTITQDLDLGNYPLYDGIQVFRPIQYIQCSNTLTSLTGNQATDTAGC